MWLTSDSFSKMLDSMILIALILGLVIGAAAGYGAATLLRRAEREQHRAALAAIESNREQLAVQMRSISDQVMRETSKQLEQSMTQSRKLETERARHELDRRSSEIRNAVDPVKEQLNRVNSKIESLERQRVESQGRLSEQLKELRQGVGELADSAGGLTAALRKPSGRGSWGEIQLRNVIELSGMVEHCDFETQVSVGDGEGGRLRPDVVVNMPGGKQVVVDAKVPMEAFLDAQEAGDEESRERHLERHARQLRQHVDTLKTKSYQDQFATSPELVVMFIPSEGIYYAALAADSRLLEHGLKERVLIATPTTLIGLLRAIGYGWGQERLAESAHEIAEIGRELHRRVNTFIEPLEGLGRSLNTTVERYNQAVASYERRVVPQMRRIEQAGAKSGKEITELRQVESNPATITQAPVESEELTERSG